MKSFIFKAVGAALLGEGLVSARLDAPLAPRAKEVCTVYRVSYLAPIPGPGYVTTTRPYTGTVPITEPTTVTTIQPTGTKPGTVIIETPVTSPAARQTVTVTRPYTGDPPITSPITSTTITPPATTEPITVVIATPRGITTVTRPYTGSTSITAPITASTETPADAAQPLTVVIETPAPIRETVTVTRAYTGTSAITAPITSTTITPSATTEPITVVLATPGPTRGTVTVTSAYTGSSSINGPITSTTITPSASTEPITVVIATPVVTSASPVSRSSSTPTSTSSSTSSAPSSSSSSSSSSASSSSAAGTRSTVTETSAYDGTSAITAPITATTITPTDATAPVTVVIQTPPPVFECDVHGYLISDDTLFSVDLASGEETMVKEGLDGGGGNINAIGYNTLDNFIYGISGKYNPPKLIRIDASGNTKVMGEVPRQTAGGNKFWYTGDIDQDGYLWATGNGAMYIKVDLIPDSSTFGTVVDQGEATPPDAGSPFDWSYVPGAEGKLYSILSKRGGGASLGYFDTSAKTWTTVKDYGPIVGRDMWGASYAGADGSLYAGENEVGDIYRFPPDGSAPVQVTSGPPSKKNDGARCAKAPNVAS